MGYRWKEGIIPEGYLEGEERQNDDGSGDKERRYWYQNPETGKREYETAWTKYKEGDEVPEIEGRYRYETSGQKWKNTEVENILNLQQRTCGNLHGPERTLCEQKFAAVARQRGVAQYALGGEVAFLENPNMNYNFIEDVPLEQGAELLATTEELLTPEEENILTEVFEQYPEMEVILDKVSMSLIEDTGITAEGAIEGPGTETSDSINAKLSDGEFVFTAKAVKQIGVDKLRKMMDKAETDYDEQLGIQEAKQVVGSTEDGYFLGGLLSFFKENHENYREPEPEPEGGILRDSYGNPVTSGSGEVVRTRYPDDIPTKQNNVQKWADIMNRAKANATSEVYLNEPDNRQNSSFVFDKGFVPKEEAIITEPPPIKNVPLPPLEETSVPEPQSWYNQGGLLNYARER